MRVAAQFREEVKDPSSLSNLLEQLIATRKNLECFNDFTLRWAIGASTSMVEEAKTKFDEKMKELEAKNPKFKAKEFPGIKLGTGLQAI